MTFLLALSHIPGDISKQQHLFKWQRFVGLSKMWGPEIILRGNTDTQKLKYLLFNQENSCTTHPPNVPSLSFPQGYKNISRNANFSSSFKSAFLDNIEEDYSYAVCLPLPCVHITHIRSPWDLLLSWYLLSLLIFWVAPGYEEMKVKSCMAGKGYLTLGLHMKRAECFIPRFVCIVMLY